MNSVFKVFFFVSATVSLSLSACNNNTEPKTDEKTEMQGDTTNRPLTAGEKIIYQCEMDTDVKSDKPGKCPKCGMTLVRVIVKDTVK